MHPAVALSCRPNDSSLNWEAAAEETIDACLVPPFVEQFVIDQHQKHPRFKASVQKFLSRKSGACLQPIPALK